MNTKEYLQFHRDKCDEMIEITARKNNDYAGHGDDDPFANFRLVNSMNITSVEIGFLTRITDKISRINSFCQGGKLLVKDESVNDTLLDLANYAILMAGYLESERRRIKAIPNQLTIGEIRNTLDHVHLAEQIKPDFNCHSRLVDGSEVIGNVPEGMDIDNAIPSSYGDLCITRKKDLSDLGIKVITDDLGSAHQPKKGRKGKFYKYKVNTLDVNKKEIFRYTKKLGLAKQLRAEATGQGINSVIYKRENGTWVPYSNNPHFGDNSESII